MLAPVLPGNAHTQGQVRRVERAPEWRPELEHLVPEEQVDEDLTSTFAPCGVLRAVSVHEPDSDEAGGGEICAAVMFDMTYSDSDEEWTYAPDAVDHLRVVESQGNFGDLEIILDSGADGSALPLSAGWVAKLFKRQLALC